MLRYYDGQEHHDDFLRTAEERKLELIVARRTMDTLSQYVQRIRENLDASDADWERIKNSVDAFMKRGLAAPSEK